MNDNISTAADWLSTAFKNIKPDMQPGKLADEILRVTSEIDPLHKAALYVKTRVGDNLIHTYTDGITVEQLRYNYREAMEAALPYFTGQRNATDSFVQMLMNLTDAKDESNGLRRNFESLKNILVVTDGERGTNVDHPWMWDSTRGDELLELIAKGVNHTQRGWEQIYVFFHFVDGFHAGKYNLSQAHTNAGVHIHPAAANLNMGRTALMKAAGIIMRAE